MILCEMDISLLKNVDVEHSDLSLQFRGVYDSYFPCNSKCAFELVCADTRCDCEKIAMVCLTAQEIGLHVRNKLGLTQQDAFAKIFGGGASFTEW